MEDRAPSVVAVIVTTGPAPGLEASLTTLAGQDYQELSILVVANGGDHDVAARVAAIAPRAFVKISDENRGFAAACNEATLMVEGAVFYVFCHDDVLFLEGAISQLVESAFRNNAGIVTPKVVAYDDPYILVHAGQIVDRFGTVSERVELGEIDHGQQDLERDVFVAPGGVTLVRADLFDTLHGFDPLIPAIGEDLDLCWRAQVAGARIVVAPSAVIAHRQTLATGERSVVAVGTRSATLRDLQRRHQLATVLTCWSRHTLFGVVPLLVGLDVVEWAIALVGRDTDRAGAIAGSWRWVWRNRRSIRQRRKALGAIRVLRDTEIIRLQVAGASRVTTFFTTLVHEGLDRARGVLPDPDPLPVESSFSEAGFGRAFGDEVDDIAALDDSQRPHHIHRWLTSTPSRAITIVAAAVLWMYATRNLVATTLPIVGRLAPLDSWWDTWRHFFASWSSSGVGTGTPGEPAYAFLGVFGTFVFGRMGILPRVVLLFAAPLGAVGVWRLLKSVVSDRARLIGALSYLAFPIAANMMAAGRLDVMIVLAVLPFSLRRILALLHVPEFIRDEPLEPVLFGHRGWRATRSGQLAGLLLQVAFMTAMAPAALVVVEIFIAGLVLAQRLAPQRSARLDRPWGLAGNILVGTAVLLLPLTYDVLAAGSRALDVFGLQQGSWTALSFSQILRGATGPFGYGWGAWLLPLGAALALILARDARRELALRLASVLVVTIVLVGLVGRNWLGVFAPDIDVVMVLVGLVIAMLVAVFVSALENDVARYRPLLRTFIAAVGIVLLLAATLPLFASAVSGRFQLPETGTPESLGSLSTPTLGGYRVLWLGEPSVLPVAGWSVAPGLAAATTTDGLPSGASLLAAPDSGAFDGVLAALHEMLVGQTVQLGQLLAPDGISSIVVMTSLAPSLSGVQDLPPDAPPGSVIPSLDRQSDLSLTSQAPGAYVFTNTLFHGIVAQCATSLTRSVSSACSSSSANWKPVLNFEVRKGPVASGTVLVGLAPAGAFDLAVNGHLTKRSTSLGGLATFTTSGGDATLELHQLPLNGLLALVTLGLWLTFLLGFGVLERLDHFIRSRRRGGVFMAPPPPSADS